MKWFKFYGQDFLTDPKMRSLSVERRHAWIVLLCMANGEDKDGKIYFIKEDDVLNLTGTEFDGQTWYEALGFLRVFEELKMITIDNENDNGTYDITLLNFNSRQGEAKTGYERLKAYRERKKHDDNAPLLSKTSKNVIKKEANDNNDNKNDNNRLDKIREDNIYNTGDSRPDSSKPLQGIISKKAEQLEVKPTGISTEWQEKGFRYAEKLGITLGTHAKARWLKIFKQASEGRKPANLEKAYSYLIDYPKPMSSEQKLLFFFKIYENGLQKFEQQHE